MFESIYKEEIYSDLLPKVHSLCEGESDTVARMANVAALIHRGLEFWWTGFYRVVDDELVLGPFQGPVACIRIAYGKGVCGTAWKEGKTIVVPVFGDGEVCAVLDIDSRELGRFDDSDAHWLEEIVRTMM